MGVDEPCHQLGSSIKTTGNHPHPSTSASPLANTDQSWLLPCQRPAYLTPARLLPASAAHRVPTAQCVCSLRYNCPNLCYSSYQRSSSPFPRRSGLRVASTRVASGHKHGHVHMASLNPGLPFGEETEYNWIVAVSRIGACKYQVLPVLFLFLDNGICSEALCSSIAIDTRNVNEGILLLSV